MVKRNGPQPARSSVSLARWGAGWMRMPAAGKSLHSHPATTGAGSGGLLGCSLGHAHTPPGQAGRVLAGQGSSQGHMHAQGYVAQGCIGGQLGWVCGWVGCMQSSLIRIAGV